MDLMTGNKIPFCTSSSLLARTEIFLSSDNEAASNLSDFFFRFHFQGLKSLPRAENLLFLSRGGVRAPEPKLFVRNAAPFCFFAITVLAATSFAAAAAAAGP